jgi:nucleotide-binding universal stress UspA family protein
VVHNARVTSGETASFELGTDGPTVILAGVDGSPSSLRAGAYAAGLARRQQARLVVVYVSPLVTLATAMPLAGVAVVGPQNEAFDEISDALRRQVEGQARERGITATFVARRGDAFSELRRVADEVRAEAVVVGASAQAGHRLVGSVAVRLVRAGKWPVTVVP